MSHLIGSRLAKILLLVLMSCLAGISRANDNIHFLIPGGTGGGWDITARGIGEALTRSKLLKVASYENLSGGGGGKAIAHLIETAERQPNTLMISSSPIILRSLKKIFPQSYTDLTPVAAIIADYGAFVVRADSPYTSWQQMMKDFLQDPRKVKVAGGSSRGSMDHLVAAMAFKKSGGDPAQLRYIPYNAGGHAMVGLLSGETQLLSTGLSEAIALSRQGEVRVLAMTASERMSFAPSIPTLVEQGVAAVFTNWRGFFGPPGLAAARQRAYHQLFDKMYQTREWEEIRQNRGWSNLPIVGAEFVAFLAQQQQEMSVLATQLGLLQ